MVTRFKEPRSLSSIPEEINTLQRPEQMVLFLFQYQKGRLPGQSRRADTVIGRDLQYRDNGGYRAFKLRYNDEKIRGNDGGSSIILIIVALLAVIILVGAILGFIVVKKGPGKEKTVDPVEEQSVVEPENEIDVDDI